MNASGTVFLSLPHAQYKHKDPFIQCIDDNISFVIKIKVPFLS